MTEQIRCATEGCANAGTEYVEYGGIGSHYCLECANKIREAFHGDANKLHSGERQVSPTVDGIRRDHVARYKFAIEVLKELLPNGGNILDFACGVGYGSKMLAEAGYNVHGYDKSFEAIEYANEHYSHPNIAYFNGEDVSSHMDTFPPDVVVCFETIEHLEDPRPFLKKSRKAANLLIASVPNEKAFPHRGKIKFHYRHYTPTQLKSLLDDTEWDVGQWNVFEQIGPESGVTIIPESQRISGRTIVVVAHHLGEEPPTIARDTSEVEPDLTKWVDIAPVEHQPTTDPTHIVDTTTRPDHIKGERVPEHVVILGLGPSLEIYFDYTKRRGGRKALSDEVWAINAIGDIAACDRIFHMDDMRVQELRADALPKPSNISTMVDWLKTHPGPIYTSRVYDDYPGLVEFPLEDVINSTGEAYFNSTVAYAMAYAIHIGAKEVTLFGCDFSYPNAHDAEKGRACLEFWIGFAKARGIKIGVPENTSLLDMIEGWDAHFYGYDSRKVKIDRKDGHAKVTFEERPLPTAEEIEARYDHSKHPNRHAENPSTADNDTPTG